VRLRWIQMAIAGAVIASFCSLHFIREVRRWEGNFLHGLELKYLDHKFQARGPVPVTPKVVIAAVDEKAIARFGVWGSWDRTVFASMISNLIGAGAVNTATRLNDSGNLCSPWVWRRKGQKARARPKVHRSKVGLKRTLKTRRHQQCVLPWPIFATK
jgi:hypothetical protein